jgi:hypothetical protein
MCLELAPSLVFQKAFKTMLPKEAQAAFAAIHELPVFSEQKLDLFPLEAPDMVLWPASPWLPQHFGPIITSAQGLSSLIQLCVPRQNAQYPDYAYLLGAVSWTEEVGAPGPAAVLVLNSNELRAAAKSVLRMAQMHRVAYTIGSWRLKYPGAPFYLAQVCMEVLVCCACLHMSPISSMSHTFPAFAMTQSVQLNWFMVPRACRRSDGAICGKPDDLLLCASVH